MIVRVKIKGHQSMMFGNSYKDWDMQAREFFRIYPEMLEDVLSVEVSKSEWIGWGGLKCCQEGDFQAQLNNEGTQDDEPPCQNPRLYEEMIFHERNDLIEKLG